METFDPVADLYARAAAAGIPMNDICARAKVAASTPSRWKGKHNGANLSTLNSLNDALSSLIAERRQAA